MGRLWIVGLLTNALAQRRVGSRKTAERGPQAVGLYLEHAEALVAALGTAGPALHRFGRAIQRRIEVVIDTLAQHHQGGTGLLTGVGLRHGGRPTTANGR